MTTVNIDDKSLIGTTRIRDIDVGELFRTNSNIYVMTDETDENDKSLAMLISSGGFGLLKHFDECDRVTRLDGTISVTIN